MPLVITYQDHRDVLQVICDYCGAAILTSHDGNYQWPTAPFDDGTRHPLVFTHKACCEAFERAHADTGWSAMGLECLPYFLMQTLAVSWQTAQATARRISQR